MEATAKIKGLDEAMKAMQAAFPDDYKQQSRLVNGAMGGSARKSILPISKQLAMVGDGSGALSESLKVRAQKAKKQKGKAGGMEVVPVRHDKKALALYISHYFTSLGRNAPANIISTGIRHGHLVEFGTVKKSARPFLWPSAVSGKATYVSLFAGELKKRMESAVKRAAKKAGKK